MKNGTGIATRVLLINSIVSAFAFIAQVTSLAVYGPSHSYWVIYLILMLTIFVASLVAQWAVRKSLQAGMNFYAWMCFSCIGGMVCIDPSILASGFPLILFTLTLGVLGLGLTVGYTGSVPFAVVSSIAIMVAGIKSGDLDSAIVATALMGATAAMSSENARTARRLDELETAVGAYIDAKRELREEVTRRGSDSATD